MEFLKKISKEGKRLQVIVPKELHKVFRRGELVKVSKLEQIKNKDKTLCYKCGKKHGAKVEPEKRNTKFYPRGFCECEKHGN